MENEVIDPGLTFSESASTWAAMRALNSASLRRRTGVLEGQDLDGQQGRVGRAGLARAHGRHRNALGHLDGREQRVQPAQPAALDGHADDRPGGVGGHDAGQVGGLAGHGDEDLGAFGSRTCGPDRRVRSGERWAEVTSRANGTPKSFSDVEGVLDDLQVGFAADENDDVHDVSARLLVREVRPGSPAGADVAAVVHALEMDPAAAS